MFNFWILKVFCEHYISLYSLYLLDMRLTYRLASFNVDSGISFGDL